MLAAREDLVNQVVEIAKRKGVTLFSMINDLLSLIVRLDGFGVYFREAFSGFKTLKAAKEACFILVPEGLLYDIVDKIVEVDKGWSIKKWFEAGEWCGKYYSMKYGDKSSDKFIEDLPSLLWNLNEFKVIQDNNEGEKITVYCSGLRLPENYSILLSAFLEGAFNALGYKCLNRNVVKSVITLELVKE